MLLPLLLLLNTKVAHHVLVRTVLHVVVLRLLRRCLLLHQLLNHFDVVVHVHSILGGSLRLIHGVQDLGHVVRNRLIQSLEDVEHHLGHRIIILLLLLRSGKIVVDDVTYLLR